MIHLHAALQHTDSPTELGAQIRSAFSLQPDTVDWTEVETQRQVEAIDSRPGYLTYWGTGRADVHPKNYAPISWRHDKFSLVSAEVKKACDGRANVQPDRWFCRVVLRDKKTGAHFAVVSGHMPPHIQNRDWLNGPHADYIRRSHKNSVNVWSSLILEHGPAIGGTDSNCTDFPKRAKTGIAFAATGPTHGDRRIDWVGRTSGVKFSDARTVPIGTSDHRGITVNYAIHEETTVVYNREEAAKRAEASTTNEPGTCQLWTRTIFGAPSVGDRDKDGDSDAVDGWKSEPSTSRHTDRNPPRGVPIAWSGGSHGYGHRAVSLGKNKDGVNMVRSTDAPVRGKVGTVPLDWFEKNWGLTYLGWSDTISGIPIPKPVTEPKPTRVSKAREALLVQKKSLQEALERAVANNRTSRATAIRAAIKSVDAALKALPTR